ncbi:VWA domain-containing protein [Nonomuraea jiangxiensis]|uniref:Ca-activated chloride channel family protein n=1 Tax=Nonomuraea jiangxiensis TaxID=633440 RepID=A0A1G7YTV2_9ACTN|nr:VWA domain-containing protein [Nonomuraea jiangxiensis]SDG99963.1 Ca-activated chloride channel family protein [Nonomuraea jiangxiensis]
MSLISPGWLLLLVPVALLAVAYVLMGRRRSSYAVRFTNLDLLDKVAPRRPGWRRHVPAAALLFMFALLVVGFARPTAEMRVPRERATIMVAFDVSASMGATDVSPNRFAAAQEAARQFVQGLPERFNLGLVSFSSAASLAVPPTTDRQAVLGALDRLSTASGTAIGEAVYSSLEAIASLDSAEEAPPAHIVLLSDGSNTTGRTVSEAAAEAAGRGVPVTTIAYGTADGTIVLSGREVPVPVDGPALRELAERAGGGFYEAATGDELQAVYDDIGTSVGYRTEVQEVWQWFVAAGLIFALIAAVTSMLWFSRLP